MRMIHYCLLITLLISGCATQSAMPLGNDMLQIDVSAAPVYGRAGAQDMAFKKAAEATIANGYDKFIVVESQGWTEQVGSGHAYGEFSGDANFASGSYSSNWGMYRKPEVHMIIKMFRYKDKGSSKAIDAHKIIAKK